MSHSNALIPHLLENEKSQLQKVFCLVGGSLLVTLLAQFAIPLPFSPVPITGQTFGVALLSLNWGRRLAGGAFLLYLLEGSLGLPVFSLGKSGLYSPTMGYLFGMLAATQVIGYFADQGAGSSLWKSFGSCVLGSLVIFAMGLLGLSFFVPGNKLLISGLYPFLLGDFLKNLCASSLTYGLRRIR